MKRIKIKRTGLIVKNNSYEGISVEQMFRNLMKGEKVETTGGDINYTDRKDGVRPEFNIRTDRFEIAQEAIDTAQKAYITGRDHVPEAGKTDPGKPVEGTVTSE